MFNQKQRRHKAGIVGFQGYSGAELVRLLEHHPSVEPFLLEHRADSAGKPLPISRSGPARLPCDAETVRSQQIEMIFLATPPEVSMELAPLMLKAGAKVVDLSGAFRLGGAETYALWYGAAHTSPQFLTQAVYGLPEVNRAAIVEASLVANPGCYPTAANLALLPLAERGLFDRAAGVICDAKSGVSGAGRKPSLKTSFCEVAENLSVYSVWNHRHVPEVLMITGLKEEEFSFTAQLLPIDRGILETIYFRVSGLSNSTELLDIYLSRYSGECFVRLYESGQFPDIQAVRRTNFCDIGFHFDPATGRVLVVAAIDNLVKGAAGQAIQNMNLMLGLPEAEGLL